MNVSNISNDKEKKTIVEVADVNVKKIAEVVLAAEKIHQDAVKAAEVVKEAALVSE
jgi:hypothetical protein